MRTEIKRMVAVIDERTGTEFERAFNEKMEELASYKVDIRYAPTREFLVYINYEREVKLPDTVKEEFLIRGEVYQCGDCPMLQRNPDRRSDRHSCPRSKMVHSDTPACSYFYEALKEGRIEVAL